MNKLQLTAKAAKKSTYTIKETGDVLDTIIDAVKDELNAGGKVHISGFGTLEVRKRASRKARNPKTGAEVDLPSRKYIVFVPCKELKESVK